MAEPCRRRAIYQARQEQRNQGPILALVAPIHQAPDMAPQPAKKRGRPSNAEIADRRRAAQN